MISYVSVFLCSCFSPYKGGLCFEVGQYMDGCGLMQYKKSCFCWWVFFLP